MAGHHHFMAGRHRCLPAGRPACLPACLCLQGSQVAAFRRPACCAQAHHCLWPCACGMPAHPSPSLPPELKFCEAFAKTSMADYHVWLARWRQGEEGRRWLGEAALR